MAAQPAVLAPAFDLTTWEKEMELGPEDNGTGRIRQKVYLITFARVPAQTALANPRRLTERGYQNKSRLANPDLRTVDGKY